jgi:hypothetical protein
LVNEIAALPIFQKGTKWCVLDIRGFFERPKKQEHARAARAKITRNQCYNSVST